VACAPVRSHHITLTVLYFDQETNACLEAMRNMKFLEYYATLWMGRLIVRWELRNRHRQILSHALAQLRVRNECHLSF